MPASGSVSCTFFLIFVAEGRGAGAAVLPARTRSSTSMCRSDSASCLVRSWQVIPPPQLQPNRSSSIRNHYPVLSHRAEGVRYLTSGPYEAGSRVRAYTDVLVACPEGRYRATSAPLSKQQAVPRIILSSEGLLLDRGVRILGETTAVAAFFSFVRYGLLMDEVPCPETMSSITGDSYA